MFTILIILTVLYNFSYSFQIPSNRFTKNDYFAYWAIPAITIVFYIKYYTSISDIMQPVLTLLFAILMILYIKSSISIRLGPEGSKYDLQSMIAVLYWISIVLFVTFY